MTFAHSNVKNRPMKHKKLSFEEYFTEIYGDRWPNLKSSLLNVKTQVIRETFSENIQSFSEYKKYDKSDPEVIKQQNTDNKRTNYIMDLASIICANSLDISPDDFVLDMCAAPGGKSLILLEKLQDDGMLWLNELSPARRVKLKSVIKEYVPDELIPKLHIKGKDGARYGLMHPNTFNKVLLDAPCSGEKHMLQSPKELKTWNIKRTKRLAAIQYGLLCSALLSTKESGQILYSTCSISPLENDGVIEKILSKKSADIELDLPQLNYPGVEKTKYGFMMLPDKSGIGPIYFSRLKKKTSTSSKLIKDNR